MTSTRVWRTENTDADEMNVMNATSWKSEAQRRNDRIGDQAYNKISAPDAQLVYFLDHYFHRDWGRRDFDLVARYRGGNNRYVLKRSVLFPREGDQSVPLLLGDGTMAYIKRDTDWGYAHCVNGGRASYLLGRPIDELMRRVENLERKALKRKRKMFEDEEDKIEDQDHDMDSKEVDLEASDIPKTDWLETRPNEISKESSRLWVDKYAPNNFSDLLSDEKINREVLRALHEWDPFVFRKNPPARPVNTDWVQGNKGYRKDNHTTAGKVVRAFKQYALDGESEEQGEHSTNEKARDIRPALEKRVILLSGPPGTWKMMNVILFHVIAMLTLLTRRYL
jgi:chromosome transmission fidelity protein 18